MKGIQHFPSYFGGLSAIGWRWLRLTPSLKSFIITISAVKPVPYPLEQLGDRDGHAMNSGMDSCETVEGVTKGPFGQALSCGNGMGQRRKS